VVLITWVLIVEYLEDVKIHFVIHLVEIVMEAIVSANKVILVTNVNS